MNAWTVNRLAHGQCSRRFSVTFVNREFMFLFHPFCQEDERDSYVCKLACPAILSSSDSSYACYRYYYIALSRLSTLFLSVAPRTCIMLYVMRHEP